jgi:transposase
MLVANRLAMDKALAVQQLHAAGRSRRDIARTLQIDRKTVNRVLREQRPVVDQFDPQTPIGTDNSKGAKAPIGSESITEPDSDKTPVDENAAFLAAHSRSACRAFASVIKDKLEQGLSAVRIYQDLKVEYGYTESYDSVRRFAKKLLLVHNPPFRRIEVEPGYELQVDYGMGAKCHDGYGKLGKTHVFRCVLSHSRKGYSEAVKRLTTESFIRSLENAFRALGGVPQTVVFDNAKAVVTQADWYDPELNPKIIAFCKHYDFVLLPTRPATPRHKGKVERGVDYVQENALKGKTFESLQLQNEHLRHWEKRVADTRLHGTTKKHVGQLFENVERATLKRLPLTPFPLYEEGKRKVARDGHIEIKRSYYSSPPEYVGQEVWVQWDSRIVRILNERFETLAVHPRIEVGRFSTLPKHIVKEKIHSIEQGAKFLLGKARLVGPLATRWAEAALSEHGIQGMRIIQGLLSLTRTYECSEIERACEIAWRNSCFRYRSLKRLMKQQQATQQTMEFMDEHPAIRPMSEYGEFLKRTL